MFKVVAYTKDLDVKSLLHTTSMKEAETLVSLLNGHDQVVRVTIYDTDLKNDHSLGYRMCSAQAGEFAKDRRFVLQQQLEDAVVAVSKVTTEFYRNEDREIGRTISDAEHLLLKALAMVKQADDDPLNENDLFWLKQ